jgi:hypothetical protein
MATASAISGSPASGTLDLRPLGLGELLDRTIAIYRNHFPLFVGISALPQLVFVTLQLVQFALVRALPFGFPLSRATEPGASRFLSGSKLDVVTWVLILAGWFAYSVAMGATTFAVSEIYLGRPSSVRGAYRMVGSRIWRLTHLACSVLIRTIGCFLAVFLLSIGAVLLLPLKSPRVAVLAVFCALAPAVVLSLMLSLRYGVSIPALLIENLQPRQAIKRSAELTRGRLLGALLIFVSMALVALTIAAVFQAPPQITLKLLARKGVTPLWLWDLTSLMAGVGRTLGSPLLTIAFLLFYYDLRIRIEAFDLQVMMAALVPDTGSQTISTGETSETHAPSASARPASS